MGGIGSGRPVSATPASKGAAQLLAWLESNRDVCTAASLAETVGISRTTLYRAITGRRELTVSVAVAIEYLTGVRCKAWTEPAG